MRKLRQLFCNALLNLHSILHLPWHGQSFGRDVFASLTRQPNASSAGPISFSRASAYPWTEDEQLVACLCPRSADLEFLSAPSCRWSWLAAPEALDSLQARCIMRCLCKNAQQPMIVKQHGT